MLHIVINTSGICVFKLFLFEKAMFSVSFRVSILTAASTNWVNNFNV
jgi:hypothetical protein